jgi:amidophosphoribosyltransferase
MSGIISLYSLDKKNIAQDLFDGAVSLHNRGENGYGVGLVDLDDRDVFRHIKGPGLAYDGLKGSLKEIHDLASYAGIGHTLYKERNNFQPVKAWSTDYIISMAMDGVLLGFRGKDDSVMASLFSDCLKEKRDFFTAGEMLMEYLDGRGAYNVVSLIRNGDDLYNVSFRDPKGIRPMCLGKKGNTYVVASESKELDSVEADFIRDLEPGEMVIISNAIKDGIKSKVLKRDEHAHCSFEWVYTAGPTSNIEGKNVGHVREMLGGMIAMRHDIGEDIHASSPDSGRGAMAGYHQTRTEMKIKRILDEAIKIDDLGAMRKYLEKELPGLIVPLKEAIIKNQGARRTFLSSKKEKDLSTRGKFFINSEIVNGKKVLVIDDSIVSGNVTKKGTARKMYKSGASALYFATSCPPLVKPCFKDDPNRELAARGMSGSAEEIGRQVAKELGVDEVFYPTIGDLKEAIGLPDLCTACFGGEYPVKEEFLGI